MNKGKVPDPVPLLVVISYWSGDLELTRRMVDLIVDLEPVHVGRAAEILLVCRQDTQIDQDMVKRLATRFNVHTLKANSPMRGWPAGCNGMFSSSMIHVCLQKQRLNCSAVYWMEGDCTPMYPRWFDALAAAWSRRARTTSVMGCVSGTGDGRHITGCAIYDPEVVRKVPTITRSVGGAWDWDNRKVILGIGEHTPLVHLAYRGMNAGADQMRQGAAVVHGFKDGSLLDLVRRQHIK